MDRPRTGTPCSSSAAGVFCVCPGLSCPGLGWEVLELVLAGDLASVVSTDPVQCLLPVWWGRRRRSTLGGPNGGEEGDRTKRGEGEEKKEWLGVWALEAVVTRRPEAKKKMEKKRRVSEEKGKRRSQRGVWGERNCTAAPGPWMLLCKVICQAAGWRGRAYVIRGAVGANSGHKTS